MWAQAIVLSEPGSDDDLGLLGGVEVFCVEDFAAQCAVDALVVTVLPRRPWIDLDRLDPDLSQPVLQCCSGELRAIIGTDVFERPALQ